MATPIQFITEQIANDAITADKVDLANGTYNFASGAVLQATTQSQEDGSTKVATTSYVDTAISNAAISEGPGIDVTGNKISADISLGTAGLTFSATGDAGKLQVALNPSDPSGMEINASGFLGVALEANGAGGIEFVGSGSDKGALKVALIASTGLTFNATGIAIALDGATLVQSTSGLKVKAGGISATELADDAVTTAKILDANVTAAKLASNAVTNAKLGDDSVGIDEIALADQYQEFTAGSSQTLFELTVGAVLPKFAQVFKNGQRMAFASSPSGVDEYSLSGQNLTFGSAVTQGALIQVSYLSAGSPV